MKECLTYLAVIDGERDDLGIQIADESRFGGNFLLVSTGSGNFQVPLASSCGIEPLPKPLNRAALCSLTTVIEPGDFDALLFAHEQGKAIFFIEQLDLPLTKPPHVERYLVYCAVRGIISQHKSIGDAKEGCKEYLFHQALIPHHPEPGVYEWRD